MTAARPRRARPPAAPARLKVAGKALWRAILSDVPSGFELDHRELHLLARACRCADEIAMLEKSIDKTGPVVTGSRGQPVLNRAMEEVRLARLAEARLLSMLALEERDAGATSPRSLQARRAAHARWDRRDGLRALQGGVSS